MRQPVTIIGIDCAVQAPDVGLARGELRAATQRK